MLTRIQTAQLVVAMVGAIGLISPSKALANSGYAVLEKYCFACHGPEKQQGGLRLDTAAGLLKGGDSGESAVVPGKADVSLLWTRLGVDHDMPPEGKPQPTDAERELVRLWIAGGAEYPTAKTSESPEILANKVVDVFQRHCLRCHGSPEQKKPGLDMRQHESLVLPVADRTAPYVIAGNVDDSLLWRKIDNESMPPKSAARLTDEEKQIVSRWITAGAPPYVMASAGRPRIDESSVQSAIRDHLRKTPRSFRKHMRYFTFVHLHNNPTVSDSSLQLYKAALAKLINSLSWEAWIVVPEAIDDRQTVFAIDLRHLGWTDEKQWEALLAQYPYALEHQRPAAIRQLGEEILDLSDRKLPEICLRADWFVAKASRPPLYETLLELPETAEELEKQLEVNVIGDWQNGDLARGGVTQSGVSTQNRLLDRHRALHGSYWKSYDFEKSEGKGDLRDNPLGPTFADHPFPSHAFEHDGGEMIFHLPNGLQGYFLTDGKGKRINEGPIKIVQDPNQWSGSTVIVNGLSCMGCHKNGMIHFRDVVEGTARLPSTERDKLEELYVTPARMNVLMAADEKRYLNALLDCMGPYLGVNSVEQMRNLELEPIGRLAQFYHADIDLQTAAAELNYDPQAMPNAIRFIPGVADILGPLLPAGDAGGGVIKRSKWEARASNLTSVSPFQSTAAKLKNGANHDEEVVAFELRKSPQSSAN